MSQEGYIDLNRAFCELPYSAASNDDLDTREALLRLRGDKATHWGDLLKEYRVVVIAEAGAGKTWEIKQAALKVRAEGKPSFFVRLEHVVEDFEGAFEEAGTFAEFQGWLNSTDEGWLFLDSVDEARLKDPKDFEKAIKKISSQLGSAMQRVHIVITGRPHAWRPKTDLNLCETKFPFQYAVIEEIKKEEIEEGIDEENTGDDVFSGEEEVKETQQSPEPKKDKSIFKIYSLSNLSSEQVKVFAQGKGVSDGNAFLKEIERKDAWSFTSRPQDLEETVAFWNEHGRLGSPLELMQHSIKRRLVERDQDRAEASSLTAEQATKGIKLIAAATTLTHESTIRVPDGANTTNGIDLKTILTDWSEKDRLTLLSRPIFDEAIYGTVRFHHRSVREYLAAEWFAEILKKNGSRRRVENLFFREQYGMQVITPSMKPVLSWLVLLDGKVREKVLKIEPEVILEGGDPSQLPLPTRQEILSSVCKKLASRTSSPSVTDYASVQRFASPDMAGDIKRLLKEYTGNKEIVSFLLRMVWLGRIQDALPEAKSFALDSETEQYTRMAAMRAVRDVGSAKDYQDILKGFLAESEPLDRRILADLIDGLDSTTASVDWVLKALPKVEDPEGFDSQGLSYALSQFSNRLDADKAARLLNGIAPLLDQEPHIERSFCKVSEKFGWLMGCCATLVEKLIIARHDSALDKNVASMLVKISAFQQYRDFEYGTIKNDFSKLVRTWPELNYLLFWGDTEEVRRSIFNKKGERVTQYWQVGNFRSYWAFNAEDFDTIVKDITERKFLDDRLVALSLAFELYRSNERPKQWKDRLKNLAEKEDELKQALETMLHPPAQSPEHKKFKKSEAGWKKRHKAAELRRKKNQADSAKWLAENFEKLRENNTDIVTNAQHYLNERMRRYRENSSRWTVGNWRDLTKEFNSNIVNAFRDGALKYWKLYKPVLLSEGAEPLKTPYGVIFGLTGLEIESKETPGWPEGMQQEHVELACRYAICELNGFPDWFPKLYERFPGIVSSVILKEMEWELHTPVAQGDRHYLISKISWGCKWMWDGIALQLFKKIQNEPKNAKDLEGILKIIQGSALISDKDLAKMASEKCKNPSAKDHLGKWLAVWVGVDPQPAIKALSRYLKTIKDAKTATNLAMEVVVNLLGERRSSSYARDFYKTPKHLKDLYLLMHKYIKEEDDIERANKGVYSPVLRDDAQDARRKLFSMLSEITGKESFSAMVELSKTHPVEYSRAWMMHSAKTRAENDADIKAFSSAQFSDFSRSLEFTPTNHKELYELALIRFWDLKDDLEDGDSSIASLLIKIKRETEVRKYIGNWCDQKSSGLYSIPQEEELADSKKPDLRFHRSEIGEPVPVELKLADNWGGSALFERLENQLCGDYLRDRRSSCGIFLLVWRGKRRTWKIPNVKKAVDFQGLILGLQAHWASISDSYPNINAISVLGIDLTKRANKKNSPKQKTTKKKTKKLAKKAVKKKNVTRKAPKRKPFTKKATKKAALKKARKNGKKK